MKRLVALLSVPLIVLGLSAARAEATLLTFDLNSEFSGAQMPAQPLPWLTLTFKDQAEDALISANTVRFSAQASLTGTEFIDIIFFNVNPLWTQSMLDDMKFAYVSGQQVSQNVNPKTKVATDDITAEINGKNADGDGYFDVQFQYEASKSNLITGTGPDSRFGLSELSVYDITCALCSSFGVNSFNFLSVGGGGEGTFHAAAHIQGIGELGEGSGWIGDQPVPEPTTLVLLGTALLLAGRRFRARKAGD